MSALQEMTLEEYEKELKEKRKALVTGVSKEKCNDRLRWTRGTDKDKKKKAVDKEEKCEEDGQRRVYVNSDEAWRHGRESVKSVSKRPQRNDIYIQVAEIEGHVATNLYDIRLTSPGLHYGVTGRVLSDTKCYSSKGRTHSQKVMSIEVDTSCLKLFRNLAVACKSRLIRLWFGWPEAEDDGFRESAQ
ncbi:hypothetical protein Tco_0696542 [Tanacetum coccineum]